MERLGGDWGMVTTGTPQIWEDHEGTRGTTGVPRTTNTGKAGVEGRGGEEA